MLRRIHDPNIWLMNACILLVGLSSGMAISMLAVFLDERGYVKNDIGSLAAIFAFGIAMGALFMGKLIRRLSAKTTLVASLFLYTVTLALFPAAARSYWLIALDRVFDGAAAAGIWVGCETVILSRAGPKNKAFVTSVYATAIAIGYLVGPFLARGIVAASSMTVAFFVAAAVLLLTGLLVWWRLEPTEDHAAANGADGEPDVEAPLASIVWRIKCSLAGNFCYGYFQASVVLFLPLYLITAKGVEREQTILLPGFFALGMLLFVVPAGRAGDRFGHLLVMRLLGVVGTATAIGFVMLDQFWAMCAAVSVAGATIASISPISLALQGVILPPREYARGNALYNGLYAVGMLVGPPITSAIFQHQGGSIMMLHLAGLWAGFVIFSAVFARDDPAARRAATAVDA